MAIIIKKRSDYEKTTYPSNIPNFRRTFPTL